jgi:hypothetical protein
MIGHYLLTLDAEQEERVLTTRMVGEPGFSSADRCLVMVSHGLARHDGLAWARWWDEHGGPHYAACVPTTYDNLNAAIRNRILANQARRTLKDVREAAHV